MKHRPPEQDDLPRPRLIDMIEFALNNTHPIDFMLKRRGFSGHALQGFV